jgi:excisionase family DNA binding protein
MLDYKLLTVKEVAKIMKVSEKTVYRWIDARKLKACRLGRKTYRVFDKDLLKFIRKHVQ